MIVKTILFFVILASSNISHALDNDVIQDVGVNVMTDRDRDVAADTNINSAGYEIMSPLVSNLKDQLERENGGEVDLDWEELDRQMFLVMEMSDYCSRRAAMTRFKGIVKGDSVKEVNHSKYTFETIEVKVGTESGESQFVPAEVKMCAGDSVQWVNMQKQSDHIVFDKENVPKGLDAEFISDINHLGIEGDSFIMDFVVQGEYRYYSQLNRETGMHGILIVE